MFPFDKRIICLVMICVFLSACSEQPAGHPKTGDLACNTCHGTMHPSQINSLPKNGVGQTLEANTDLSNSRWELVSFGSPGKEKAVTEGHAITLVFLEGGLAGGSGSCNAYSAQYKLEMNLLSFGELTQVKKTCKQGGIAQQEADYFRALKSTTQFEAGEGWLTIHYNDGQEILNWVKIPASKP
jgi:heat shock protein HslJ